ncbi:hypothetical protein C8R43DRAFT_964153, partial [Mycena crocata]
TIEVRQALDFGNLLDNLLASIPEETYDKATKLSTTNSADTHTSLPYLVSREPNQAIRNIKPKKEIPLFRIELITRQRVWVAAIISRGPVFRVLLADCILDVEGVQHHKLVIHFYQLLAIWLCWEHDASGQLVPYNVSTGQNSVWRAFLGGRAGEPVVAVILDLAEGLLAEAGDMISSVRQGTASEYTSQRTFAIPGVERVVKRWRKALRQ